MNEIDILACEDIFLKNNNKFLKITIEGYEGIF